MKRSPFIPFLLAALSLALPVILFLSDRSLDRTLAASRRQDEMRNRARRELESLKRSVDSEAMVNKVFLDFRIALEERYKEAGTLSSEDLDRAYRTILRPFLPPHRFFATGGLSSIPLTTFRTSSGPLISSSAEALFLEMTSDTDPASDLLREVSREFSTPLRFPLSPDFLRENLSLMRRKTTLFSGVEGTRGVFWDLIGSPGSSPVVRYACILDFSRLSRDFSFRALVKSFPSESFGLAFVSNARGTKFSKGRRKAFFSPFFRKEASIRKAILRHLGKGKILLPSMANREFALFSSAQLPGSDLVPLVVFRIPDQGGPPGAAESFALSFFAIIFVSALVLIGERLLFDRGPRVRVGFMLIAVFLVVGGAPIGLASILFRSTSDQEERRMKTDLGVNLHEEMKRLDEGILERRDLITGFVKEAMRKPRFRLDLEREYKSGGNRALSEYSLGLLRASGIPMGSPKGFPFSLFAVGPDGFVRCWPDFLNPGLSITSPVTFVELMTYPTRPFIRRLESDFQRSGGKLRQPQKENLKRETILEGSFKAFFAFTGSIDLLLGMIHTPQRLVRVKSRWDEYFMLFIPIVDKGNLRFVSYFTIGGIFMEIPYLSDLVRGIGKTSLEGISAVRKNEHLFGMDFSGNLEKYPKLLELIERTKVTGLPIQVFDDGEEKVFEAFPGRHLSNFVLGGFRSTRNIEERLRGMRDLFLLLRSSLLLLGILLALWGADHILVPLRRLRRAVGAINSGNFSVRLDENRDDEFGSLARTFNGMAVGLQEGQILGKFVSSSVREAVRTDDPDSKNAGGGNREITALFSVLRGFYHLRQTRTSREVFRILETHLQAVQEAVERFGGEIDKVMGEKILVVFYHDRFPSRSEAIRAALSVAEFIRLTLQNSALESAVGMNTGNAVSGILGAASVRLDYTVIGDTVNLAARLAALARIETGTRIILSGETLAAASGPLPVKKLPIRGVRGKTREIQAYLLLPRSLAE